MLFQLHGEHTVLLQPLRCIRTHCHLCSIRYSFSPESSEAVKIEVPCPRTQHLNNVPRLRGEKHISLKILHQAGYETARQAATSAEPHALTIAPCPSLIKVFMCNQCPIFTYNNRKYGGSHISTISMLTLKALKYFRINHGDQRVFLISNHHKCPFCLI